MGAPIPGSCQNLDMRPVPFLLAGGDPRRLERERLEEEARQAREREEREQRERELETERAATREYNRKRVAAWRAARRARFQPGSVAVPSTRDVLTAAGLRSAAPER